MALCRDLDIAEYHASANVSHSKLRTFAEKGPAYYHARYVGKTLEREETAALAFGQAFETLFQGGGDAFAERVAVLPEGHGNTKAVQSAKAAAKAAGKLAISPDERSAMLEMVGSLHELERGMELVAMGEQQLTLTADAYGLTLQSRPDYLLLPGGFGGDCLSVDLKTTKCLDDMSDTGIVKLGYHTQAALVRRLCRMNDLGDARCYLLVVEKVPVYRSELIELSPELLDKGDQWLDVYAPRLSECYARNTWPRARQEVRRAGVPRWLQDEAA